MNNSNQILTKADKFVFKLFENTDTSNLFYHNYKHTFHVFESCKKIATTENIAEKELEIVLLAALFHDVGYLESYKNHEEFSIKKVTQFLKDASYPNDNIVKVNACINATKMDVKPIGILQEIVCDADMAGLGEDDFYNNSILLRKEKEVFLHIFLTQIEWIAQEVNFLKRHQYYTKYAHINFTKTKLNNLLKCEEESALLKKIG